MEFNLPIGMSFDIERKVDMSACTGHLGKGFVYATPIMVGWMEEASYEAIRPGLPEGYDSVGTSLDIKHMAPTPMGMMVKVHSELIEAKGKILKFKVEAFDERGKVAEGIHGRAIVEIDSFLKMVNSK